MATVAVVDYGMGNLRSVSKALEHVIAQSNTPRTRVLVTSDPEVIMQADRVVVPGQGAMPDCMRELGDRRGLRAAVIAAAQDRPFLGICIGLQMLFEYSEEGNVPGLGMLPGYVQKFSFETKLKIPHMGWNKVKQNQSHVLWQGIPDETRFYFVHSYFAVPFHQEIIVGTSHYGFSFTCACAQANIFCVQFHPEKSAGAGLQLLSNFVRWHP